jgi:hypothetical protein
MNDGRIDARANELEERIAALEALVAEHIARCPGSTDEDRAATAARGR